MPCAHALVITSPRIFLKRRTAGKAALGGAMVLIAMLLGLGAATLPQPAAAQAPPEVSFPITVSDDVEDSGSTDLILGLDPAATAGNDEAFGEGRAPPFPPDPAGLVARLVDDDLGGGDGLEGFPGTGMPADIRQGSASVEGARTHEIQFETPEEATEVTFSWDLPTGVAGTIQDTSDFGRGVALDQPMNGSGSATLENLSVTKVLVALEYEFPDDLVASTTKTVDADSQVDFGDTGAGIGFSGTSGSGSVAVERFDTPPSNEAIGKEHVSEYRWIIEAESGLEFGDAEVRIGAGAVVGITDPAGITIYERDAPGTGTFTALTPTDVDESGTPGDISDDTLYATTDSFSEFVLASDNNGLPVELAGFEGTAAGDDARLTWQTTSETGNAGFEVHRRRSGDPWRRVGYVESKADGGTTAEAKSYQFVAENLPVGTHQFRLRQVDMSGRSVLTDPVSVKIQMQEAVSLEGPAPNPTSAGATLSFSVRERAETTIRLFDTLGQRVATVYKGTSPAGEQQMARVDASGLPSGTYFLRLETNGQMQVRRLTVTR